MIRCILFGHKPHPTYEFARYSKDRSATYCVRCGEGIVQLVPGRPLPDAPSGYTVIADESSRRTVALLIATLPGLVAIASRVEPNLPASPSAVDDTLSAGSGA